jgi:hypothetical protein
MRVGDLVWACTSGVITRSPVLAIIVRFHANHKICYVKFVDSGSEHKWKVDNLREVLCE